MPRAERLQLILSLLRSSPGMRPGDLAARCRVSERSLFRDLQVLQAMGLPLYFDRGYQLPSPAILPALYLTGEEALALRVAAGRGAELEGPMAQALLSAQCKLALRLSAASPILELQTCLHALRVAIPVRHSEPPPATRGYLRHLAEASPDKLVDTLRGKPEPSWSSSNKPTP